MVNEPVDHGGGGDFVAEDLAEDDSLDKLKAAGPQLSHDWGSQFTSRRYQAELSTLGIRSDRR